jgi:hypothetical protein
MLASTFTNTTRSKMIVAAWVIKTSLEKEAQPARMGRHAPSGLK